MFQLPKRKHLVHKAVEPRNLGAANLAAMQARTDDFWEVKFDGCHAILVKANGVVYGYSRQGEPIAGALDPHMTALKFIKEDNFVVFCEAWSPRLIHSVINGDFRRGYKDDTEPRTLKAVLFDYVPLDHFMVGKSDAPYSWRAHKCRAVFDQIASAGMDWMFEVAQQFKTKAEAVYYVADRRDNRDELVPIDGFMRKARDGKWTAGAGSCGSVVKDKELFTVDLKVDGLVEGKGKFVGMLGAYECTYKGQFQLVGGGKLTDKQRKAIWEDQHRAEGGIGSVIEVHALGESTNGLLREPRFARFRTDKTEGE